MKNNNSMMTTNPNDAAEVARISKDLLTLRSELRSYFVERDYVINQIFLAIIMAENLLLWGREGTAKTMLAETIFDSIVGKGINGEEKKVFQIQIENETTVDDVVGPMNLAHYEQTGEMIRNIEGKLPTAHFAILDELLDGPAVTRTLNDLLNEKKLMEAPQFIDVPLMTAIGTTNRSPAEVINLYSQFNLSAFMDRFIFSSNVAWVNGEGSRLRLLNNYLTKPHKPSANVKFADIQFLVNILREQNQFPNQYYTKVFNDVFCAYRDELSRRNLDFISDRRFVKLSQVVEATALLYGRMNLHLKDIKAAGYGIANSEKDPRLSIFNDVADRIIEDALSNEEAEVDREASMLMDRIREDMINLERRIDFTDWPNADYAEIGQVLKECGELKNALCKIDPELDPNEQRKHQMVFDLERMKQKVTQNV